MHISDGALALPVLLGSAGLTATGVWLGLRRLDYDNLMTTAVLASAFFIASLIHVPLGPSSVHLLLGGLSGMVLGWMAFPCILTGLILQAVLFQFGGLTVLGVNTLNVALPAVLCRLLLQNFLARGGKSAAISGFFGGAGAVLGTALMVAVSLALSDSGFLSTAKLVVLAHLPVMIIEGVITMFVVSFLAKARPELLGIKGDADRSHPLPDSRKGPGLASWSLLLAACCLILPLRAEAHKFLVTAWVEGDSLLVESAFGDGSSGSGAEVTVKDLVTGETVLQGVADKSGMLTLPLPATVRENGNDLEVLANGGQGHQATCTVPAIEFTRADRPPQPTAPDEAKKEIGANSGLDVESLRLVVRQEVEAVMQEQIPPLRRDLRALQQEGPRLIDIVGGIGWILGLAGLAALVRRPGRDTTTRPGA